MAPSKLSRPSSTSMVSLLAVLAHSRLRIPLFAFALTLLFFILHALRPSSQHPVLTLLNDAKARHVQQQAARSSTYEEATARYWRHHQREPPPGFAHWFETAQRVNTCRVDGFEELYSSLKIWWALSPEEIKVRMERMPAIRGLGRVKVRNGQVRRWDEIEREKKGSGGEDSDARRAMQSMLEAVVGEFRAELPDLDLFVNGYDEPRVSLPYELRKELELMADHGRVRKPVEEPFELRSFGGEPTLADKVRKICLAPSTTCPTAFEQLRKTCPPSSAARKAQISAHSGSNPIVSQQYTKRFATSEGAFLVSPELEQSTWCDQPDLQDLHAAYIHPLSFTYTNQPFPVFGNSKIGGFDDILIPSWWYWFQVSQYQASADVEWEQKSDKLFWRGSNTGGYSIALNFKGWLRSRAVSQSNVPSSWSHSTSLLLADADGRTLSTTLPSHSLNQAFADIAFAAPDQGDADSLEAQRSEPTFRFTDRTPFEENYKSKAILDLDGTAYSGRFLALMQSKGAVFKAHSFKEAVEHSLIPWYHYVPVSVRLAELPSLLGFFFGVKDAVARAVGVESEGAVVGKKARKSAEAAVDHLEELRAVAEQGQEWARSCARREDHMLYAYLLVLEWGRILREDR